MLWCEHTLKMEREIIPKRRRLTEDMDTPDKLTNNTKAVIDSLLIIYRLKDIDK